MSDQPIVQRSVEVSRAAPAAKPSVSLLDDPRLLGWGAVVLVLVGWELIAILTGVNRLYLPRPRTHGTAKEPAYGALFERIYGLLRDEVMRAMVGERADS